MWDIKACLACLSTDTKLERISGIFQRLYVALTDINLSEIDGYPMYFCVECHWQMKKALAFKRRCRRAYYVLKEIANVKKQVTLKDICIVNRKKVNLTSVIGYSKGGNVDLFYIDSEEPDVETTTNFEKPEPVESKCVLVKKEFFVSGNVWNIDILPDGVGIVDEPLIEDPEPEYRDDDQIIEDVEPIDENVVIENEQKSLEAVPNESNVEDSDDGFPKIKPMRRRKLKTKESKYEIGKEFQPQAKTTLQITEASIALSNANIRRMSMKEQKDAYVTAQMQPDFLKAPFKCGMCLTVYGGITNLIKHMNDHNKFSTSEHMCKVCMTKFMDEHVLLIHVATKHLYEYTCKLCDNATFTILDKYIEHSKLNHKESFERNVDVYSAVDEMKQCFKMYPSSHRTMYTKRYHADCIYTCHICDMKFMTVDFLNTHMKNHSRLDRSLKCDICGMLTRNIKSMEFHMKVWHLYVYKCKKCGELLFNRFEAKYHRSQKHQTPDRNYSCNVCDSSYKSMNSLRQHCAIVHYSQLYCHHCIECGDSYCSLLNLYKHQLSVHKYINVDDPNTDEDRFPCAPCNVNFLSMKSYRLHALRHRHEVAGTFENACFTCRMLFDTADDYQEHITNSCKVLNRYPRKCAYCDLIMPNYKTYLKHHKRMHKGMPAWRLRDTQLCELCGHAAFDIVQHMKTHDGTESNLECRHCSPPERLRDIWKYCVHMLTFHTPRPFVCSICLEAYTTRKECKDHILKIHAPVNSYKCTTCDQEFSHIDFLNEHCKKFLHSNTEKQKKVSTVKKLYIFPHMKLNVIAFDPKVLDSVRMYMCDYAKTKQEIVRNIKDHIVFHKQDDSPRESTKKEKCKKRRRVIVIEDQKIDLSLYGQNLEIVEEDINQSDDYNDTFLAAGTERKTKIENNAEGVRQSKSDLNEQRLDRLEYDTIGYEDCKKLLFDRDELSSPVKKKRKKKKVDNSGEHIDYLELFPNEQKLAVIEEDGKQYVNINGTLYEVIYEDDTTQLS